MSFPAPRQQLATNDASPLLATPATPVPSGLLARLRAETRTEHDAIELALDLTGEGLTPAQYRLRIEQFYGFYQPLELRLHDAANWMAPWLDVIERTKTPLLLQDLAMLGSTDTGALPRCTDLPNLDSPAACFGCLYVLEGSTLGGQVIGRHLRDTLGLTPDTGGRFFDGYGPRTGPMWQQFRAAITRFSDSTHGLPARAGKEADDQVVAAARATFETLCRWVRLRPLERQLD